MLLAKDNLLGTCAPFSGITPNPAEPPVKWTAQPVQQWQSQAAPAPDAAAAAPAPDAPAADAAPEPAAAPAAEVPAAPTPEAEAAAKAFTAPVEKKAADKPDYVSDDLWDAEKGEVKVEAALAELKALKAPRSAEDYKIEVAPEVAKELGFEDGAPVFDAEAPLTKLLPGILASMGADPSKLGAAMGEVAKVLAAEEAKLRTDMVAEVGKMGENAPQRLAAMRTYIEANLPADDAGNLLHALGQSDAGALSAFEKLLNTSRGLGSPSGEGGVGKVDPNLSPTETLTQVFEQNARKGLGRRA